MIERTPQEWEYLGRPTAGGLRFFRSLQDRRIAVSDESGANPCDAEGGVLLLDKSRSVIVWIEAEHSQPRQNLGGAIEMRIRLPLERDEGTKSSCSITFSDLAWLIRRGLWSRKDVAAETHGDISIADILYVFKTNDTSEEP